MHIFIRVNASSVLQKFCVFVFFLLAYFDLVLIIFLTFELKYKYNSSFGCDREYATLDSNAKNEASKNEMKKMKKKKKKGKKPKAH